MTEACITLNPQRGDLHLEVSVGSLKTKLGFAASAWDTENELFSDYYYDDGDDEYDGMEYYEFSDDDVEDEWYDESEQTQWMVTDVAAAEEYDDMWANDENWEQIDDEIETMSGNKLQRKCLHMWGQRLCLCKFMAFLDNRKFQCQPRSNRRFYNPMGPSPLPMMMAPPNKNNKEKQQNEIK